MSTENHIRYGRIPCIITCLFFSGVTQILCTVPILPEITINDAIISKNGDNDVRMDTISVDTVSQKLKSERPALTPLDSISNGAVFFNSDGSESVLTSDTAGMIIAQKNRRRIIQDISAEFKPNPKKAWIMALVFPGGGQFYNRQYWKLPIVYGGFAGFMYAITWNNKNYQDYQQAYFDIVRDAAADPGAEHPETWGSWQDFFPGGDLSSVLRDSYRQTQLKNGKDFYRKYRDLSIILSAAFYAICVADAYVDAQMSEFNVSPDLSFRVIPELFPASLCNTRGFGINVCLTF